MVNFVGHDYFVTRAAKSGVYNSLMMTIFYSSFSLTLSVYIVTCMFYENHFFFYNETNSLSIALGLYTRTVSLGISTGTPYNTKYRYPMGNFFVSKMLNIISNRLHFEICIRLIFSASWTSLGEGNLLYIR